MGEYKQVPVTKVREGNYIMIDDAPCKVTKIQVSKPGKHGSAKYRIEGIGIVDGKKRELLTTSGDKVMAPIVDKRTAQVLAIMGDTVQLMDLQSYETFELPIPEDLEGQLEEGGEVRYWVVGEEMVIKEVLNKE